MAGSMSVLLTDYESDDFSPSFGVCNMSVALKLRKLVSFSRVFSLVLDLILEHLNLARAYVSYWSNKVSFPSVFPAMNDRMAFKLFKL